MLDLDDLLPNFFVKVLRFLFATQDLAEKLDIVVDLKVDCVQSILILDQVVQGSRYLQDVLDSIDSERICEIALLSVTVQSKNQGLDKL